MYKKAKEFDSKIVGFETSIKRPYFHVRALDWHKYLDFIERQDDLNKVVRLYEICLIACANYPEYWIRYVLSMEASGSMELADNALARATQVFVKTQQQKQVAADVLYSYSQFVMGFDQRWFVKLRVSILGILLYLSMMVCEAADFGLGFWNFSD